MKLIDYQEEFIWYGTIFSCKGKYPYEDIVSFLLCDLIEDFALIVYSGYKAGSLFCIFPQEAFSQKARAIDTEWLKQNWNKWGYFECNLEEVVISRFSDM